MAQRIRVMITVKAYPQLSDRYKETVCVAGIRLDTARPEHVRLFPVPFRDLERGKQFEKYDIIEVDVAGHTGDNRPESLRPNLDTLRRVGHIDSTNDWKQRSAWVSPLVAPSLCGIKRQQTVDGTSLGVFRPARITRFRLEPAAERSAGLEAMASQINLFDPERKKLEAPSYRFTYSFTCNDASCRTHEMGLIDWEIGAAYLSWRNRYSAEELPKKMHQKWFDEICSPKRDPHFFVGNVHQHPKTFMLLGIFYPPKGVLDQETLF
jgi:hypothetical protein